MGYSTEAIFIKPELTVKQEQDVLESLGFNDFVFNSEVNFEEADRRDRVGVYLGKCNGATYLIYDGVYGTDRNSNNLTKPESILVEKLKNHEFLSIMNYESTNSYGYHYIKDGKTVRLKEGFHPDVTKDIGEELEIEKEYYFKKEVVDGAVYFYTKSSYKSNELEKWTHDQIGGCIAFELVRMITGVSYNHDDIFYSKARQYISRKSVNDVIERFKGKNTDSNDFLKLKDYFPIECFENLINIIKPKLFNNGFIEFGNWNFEKINNELKYSISFEPLKKGELLIKPSFNYKIEAFRREWFKKTFGKDESRFGKIPNDIQVSVDKVGLRDNYYSIFTGKEKYDLEKLTVLVNKRIDEVIFPYFQKVDSLEKIANHNQSLFKLDFLLMAGKIREGEEVIKDSIEKLAISAKNDKWDEEKISNLIEEFQDRANLIRNNINIKEMFFSIFDTHPNELKEEKNKVGQKEMFDSKKIEAKRKPWWKIW